MCCDQCYYDRCPATATSEQWFSRTSRYSRAEEVGVCANKVNPNTGYEVSLLLVESHPVATVVAFGKPTAIL